MIVRTGVVLSNQGGALQPILFPYKIFIGGKIGGGQQVYSWIHISDEVEAIRYLIENKQANGVYNLCSPNPVTNNEFGKTISMILKRPHYLPLPGFIMFLAFGEVATMVLEGQRAIPKRLLDEGYKFKYATLSEALMNLLGR